MANLQFSADLIADVLFRANEPTDGTSQYAAQALSYLNRAYLGIAAGGGELSPGMREEWRWMKTTGILQLFPVIAPGIGTAPPYVSATFLGNVITFGGAIGENLISLTDWHIKIGENPDIYRIASHTINSAFAALDSVWGGPTGTYAYVAGKLEYTLASDVLRIVSPMRCFQGNTNDDCTIIHEVDPERLYSERPMVTASARMPNVYARITERLVRFNNYAFPPLQNGYTSLYRVEYDYIRRPTLLTSPGTAEEPLVPWEWRRVLADWALFWLMIDKNDHRAESIGAAAKGGLEGMASENRYQRQSFDRTPSFGTIRPRVDCGWRR